MIFTAISNGLSIGKFFQCRFLKEKLAVHVHKGIVINIKTCMWMSTCVGLSVLEKVQTGCMCRPEMFAIESKVLVLVILVKFCQLV